MRRHVLALCLIAAFLMLSALVPATGQTLYAASGAGGVAGHLFILDPATGAVVTDVGALRLATGAPLGLTGLAFDPGTGVLYGSTANASPSFGIGNSHLVTVDPATALVTDIGPMAPGSSTLADLTFRGGVLYGWQAASGHHLATVNLSTGAYTTIGPGTGDFGGGGIAADAAGTLFITPDGKTAAPGHIDTVDPVTGVITPGPLLSGHAGAGNAENALAFDAAGTLFSLDCNDTGARTCSLVTINTATGVISVRGATASNLDALAFSPGAAAVPEPGSLALLIGSVAVGSLFCRRRRA